MKSELTSKEKIRKMSSIALTILLLYLLLPIFQMLKSFCAGFIAGFNASAHPDAIGNTIDYYAFFNALIVLIVSIWIIVITFRLLKSLKIDETPFTESNGRYIRSLAFLLISIDPIHFVFALASNLISGSNLADNGINGTVFAAGLVLYCISLVFRYGCELQQESDETL